MDGKNSRRWVAREVNQERVQKIAQTFQLSRLVATTLSMQKLETDEEISKFLQPKITDCYDPFSFKDMYKAKDRIVAAIDKQEKIFIYGDYDADGITSTAILIRAIRDLGGDVEYYIPNRFTEGYGPNKDAFLKISETGCKLLITVDNGISGIEEMEYAKMLGMDVILTDHHALSDKIPDVYAIIHPKNPNDRYPFAELCGAGVALKLAHALHGKMQDAWIELATIGTICDLMSLIDENRAIVKSGLQRMMMTKITGLRTMFKMCRIELHEIEAETIGFIVGPRLNAVGRLLHAGDAVELLITDDEVYARELVEKLESFNQQRKDIVETISREAMVQAEEQMKDASTAFLVLADTSWNPGVVGIVASKIVSKFNRPAIILGGGEEGKLKGSGRSMNDYHIVDALKQVESFLLHYGGHQMAAGLTLAAENLDAFRKALNESAQEQLKPEDFIPNLYIDYFGTIEEFTEKNIKELERLAPFGSGNPRPTVAMRQMEIEEVRTMGTDQQHLRVVLKHRPSGFTCVGFHFGYFTKHLTKDTYVNVAGRLMLNEWRDKVTPQLRIEDITIPFQRNIMIIDERQLSKQLEKEKQALWIVKTPQQAEYFRSQLSNETHSFFITDNAKEIQDKVEFSSIVIAEEQCMHPALQQLKEIRSFFIYPFWRTELGESRVEREDFAKLYKKLRTLRVICDRNTLINVGEEVKMTQNNINFYLKVFFDLDFATMDNGKIIMKDNPQKRELTESKTYQNRIKRLRTLEKYARYSIEDWKRWINQVGF